MATQLFINTQASSISSALVRSLTDRNPVDFPTLVVGDGRDYEIFFINNSGGYAAFSGNPTYVPMLAFGSCGYPTGGTAVWTFNGNSTSALAYNISPAALQTALQALASVGSGNLLVAGVAGKYYTFTFAGALGDSPQPEITVDFAGLTPAGTVEITTLVEGDASPATDEVQMATLALNPISFADDWTPITNGWAGQLSTRTLEVIQAFAAGSGTLSTTFQVTVSDPSLVRTTYAKEPVTIECSIITPESFASADKPTLVTSAELAAAIAGVGAGNSYAAVTNNTGDTTLTRGASNNIRIVNVTGAARTSVVILAVTGSPVAGDVIRLRLNHPATAAIIMEVRNATNAGTLLYTYTTDGTGDDDALFEMYFDGAAWQKLLNIIPVF